MQQVEVDAKLDKPLHEEKGSDKVYIAKMSKPNIHAERIPSSEEREKQNLRQTGARGKN